MRPEGDGGDAALRADLRLIAHLVDEGSRVLDVGCGEGDLLSHLGRHKRVDGRGIELVQAGVNACVAKGLAVIQGDADRDLADYPAQAFDYVVLSQTLQATRRPKQVLLEMGRIGRHSIVSFRNYGHWRIRVQLLTSGHVPTTDRRGRRWYESPNIHPCTIKDFVVLCRDIGVTIERGIAVRGNGARHQANALRSSANLMAQQAVFVLSGP